ncbi:hypothetical protein PBCVNY2B_658L [Paramecium bursaria Chlorella virus NY2B]|uniref:Transmembrane protein n=1 Tax=Paramecium bursaria Chlorella virus NYs1 TaxID=83442 RepID=M1HHP4_9PHYC|nr:hypothetical protein FK949_gp292 [Paramecium bursaria Chlorella virus NYs1]AGE54332.1 hypothetical protein PBCVIL52s1_675L [Paramecium bursaria Chlorella virus IL-5-2s1]AGE55018.1 hypothetical protein PBCVMA1D_662L [Paramecium bursaria Chlorella virus MA1D]AGE58450.1 hypothetical protein PBCVNY2B_658L [Paramecium bursaria Chlorella virus NY2B]AGE58833.1 hypothetical protein PBCVNYs1_666L [Paramecium bursaria Chlorella virus NYs1]
MQGGIFGTIKLMIMLFSYFAAYQLGKMMERPQNQWPKAKAGQNKYMVGDWAAWKPIYMGVLGVAVLLTLLGPGGMGGMMGGFGGGYGGGGYY